MKFIYFYSNESSCRISDFNEWDLLNRKIENYFEHSNEITKKTINKEKGNNKYLHIFKRLKNNMYTWYASYILN